MADTDDDDGGVIPLRPAPQRQEPTPASPELLAAGVPGAASPGRYRRDEWRRAAICLALGAAIAGGVAAIPMALFVVDILRVIVHELGHAATSWAFGYPAIPALDLTHGGGLTPSWDRVPAIAWAAPLLVFGSGLLAAQNRLTRACVLIALALYAGLALTDWHQAAIIAMGHGLTLIIAALFIVRGLTGLQVKLGVERPLYVAIGLLFAGVEMHTAWMLLDNHVYREHYLSAKQGLVRDDLSRLADDYLHTSFEAVATGVLCGGILAVVAGLALSAVITHIASRARS